jgi:hypothetical protein
VLSTGKKHFTAFSQTQRFVVNRVVNENTTGKIPMSLFPEATCDQQNVIAIYYLLILLMNIQVA